MHRIPQGRLVLDVELDAFPQGRTGDLGHDVLATNDLHERGIVVVLQHLREDPLPSVLKVVLVSGWRGKEASVADFADIAILPFSLIGETESGGSCASPRHAH